MRYDFEKIVPYMAKTEGFGLAKNPHMRYDFAKNRTLYRVFGGFYTPI